MPEGVEHFSGKLLRRTPSESALRKPRKPEEHLLLTQDQRLRSLRRIVTPLTEPKLIAVHPEPMPHFY